MVRRFPWTAIVALAVVCMTRSALADEEFVHVVPPGQERVIIDALGGSDALAGCHLDSAAVDRTMVRVHYECAPAPAVDVELHHPSEGAGAVATTEKFALISHSTLPAGFLDALVARIRARERDFHWNSAEAAGLGAPSDTPTAVPADTTALTPEQQQLYEEGVRLTRQNRPREALDVFVRLAREQPRHGMLGTLVSLVASTMNDQAGMDQLTRQADAHPEDVLAQFMAGVAVHYHGHVQAQSYDEKRRLYARAIPYLERTLPTYSFEPRVFLYLAISHFRLGRQAEAQRLIEQAIPLAVNDPDVFYCRGEIYQHVDLPRAIADVQHYLDMVEQLHAQGVPLNPEKHARVQRMLAALQAVQRGERTLPENDALFDPIREQNRGSRPPRLWRSFTQSRSFALITLAVAVVGAIAFWLFGRAARR